MPGEESAVDLRDLRWRVEPPPVARFLHRIERHSLLHRARRPDLPQIVELTDFSCSLLPIGALTGIRIYAELSLAIDMSQCLHCQTVAMFG